MDVVAHLPAALLKVPFKKNTSAQFRTADQLIHKKVGECFTLKSECLCVQMPVCVCVCVRA